ncbi:unnamed protein product [Amoebophrya sp. A25]|nr:unnamed protein product [Amoebophrya sp. A25]|eukprot:GSA25T00009530001.1
MLSLTTKTNMKMVPPTSTWSPGRLFVRSLFVTAVSIASIQANVLTRNPIPAAPSIVEPQPSSKRQQELPNKATAALAKATQQGGVVSTGKTIPIQLVEQESSKPKHQTAINAPHTDIYTATGTATGLQVEDTGSPAVDKGVTGGYTSKWESYNNPYAHCPSQDGNTPDDTGTDPSFCVATSEVYGDADLIARDPKQVAKNMLVGGFKWFKYTHDLLTTTDFKYNSKITFERFMQLNRHICPITGDALRRKENSPAKVYQGGINTVPMKELEWENHSEVQMSHTSAHPLPAAQRPIDYRDTARNPLPEILPEGPEPTLDHNRLMRWHGEIAVKGFTYHSDLSVKCDMAAVRDTSTNANSGLTAGLSGFTRVDTITVEWTEVNEYGVPETQAKTINVLVIRDPCAARGGSKDIKLTRLQNHAPAISCEYVTLPDGTQDRRLAGATLSDNGFPIFGIVYDPYSYNRQELGSTGIFNHTVNVKGSYMYANEVTANPSRARKATRWHNYLETSYTQGVSLPDRRYKRSVACTMTSVHPNVGITDTLGYAAGSVSTAKPTVATDWCPWKNTGAQLDTDWPAKRKRLLFLQAACLGFEGVSKSTPWSDPPKECETILDCDPDATSANHVALLQVGQQSNHGYKEEERSNDSDDDFADL